MPVKRPQFANGEIYHIILRGTAGQNTFLEKRDYLRYFFSLYLFNNKEVVPNASFGIRKYYRDNFPIVGIKAPELEKPRKLLVEFLGFCLMPNHIHLLIRQVVNKGISLFFQKMGGYSSYFNKKYERFGSLFQRPFKAVHIKNDDQLLIAVTYIHMNPTDLIEPNWKMKGIANPQKVMDFLESYLWSSYPYYLGKENFSWLIDSDFLKKILKTPEDFRNFVKARVQHKVELNEFLGAVQDFSLSLE